MYDGRNQREKDRLAEAITENLVKKLKVEREEVIIVFAEAAHGNWFASGICPKSTTLCVKTKVNLIENIAKSILNEYLMSS